MKIYVVKYLCPGEASARHVSLSKQEAEDLADIRQFECTQRLDLSRERQPGSHVQLKDGNATITIMKDPNDAAFGAKHSSHAALPTKTFIKAVQKAIRDDEIAYDED